jgi:isoleucyl-tRNA synthetase
MFTLLNKTERKMFKQALNTVAKAKIIKNKKLDTLRLIVAFNVTQTNKKGDFIFPVSKKCAYVSGDLQQEDVLNAIHNAKQVLRTDNIVLV